MHMHRLWLNLHGQVVGILILLASVALVGAQTASPRADEDRAPFLDDYAGRYELTPNFILNVMRVGDALYVQGPQQSATQMRPQSQTQFVVGGRLRITFGVNLISREVDHLIFEQDGVGRRADKLYETVDTTGTPAFEVAVDVLQRYAGTYERQPGFTIVISFDDERLWAGMDDQPKRTLLPTSKTDFLYENSAARLSFKMDSEGEVTQLVLHQSGNDLMLDRKD